MHAESRKLLDSLNMDIDTRAKIVSLGVAQQQMVEVAKALSVQSKILIMDEPTAALTDRRLSNSLPPSTASSSKESASFLSPTVCRRSIRLATG